jgi:hypothetical protein
MNYAVAAWSVLQKSVELTEIIMEINDLREFHRPSFSTLAFARNPAPSWSSNRLSTPKTV